MALLRTLFPALLLAVAAWGRDVKPLQAQPAVEFNEITANVFAFLEKNGYKRLADALDDVGLKRALNTGFGAGVQMTILAPRDEDIGPFLDLYRKGFLGNFTLRGTLVQHASLGLFSCNRDPPAPAESSQTRRRLLSDDPGFVPNLLLAPANSYVLPAYSAAAQGNGVAITKLTKPGQVPIFVGLVNFDGGVLYSARVLKPDHYVSANVIVHGIVGYFINPCPLPGACGLRPAPPIR